MVLQLDPASPVPLYRQIHDQLRQLIIKGALPVGERLPPTRDLATRLSVHRTTVANAYADLEADGWIAGHVGRGTFVARGVEATPSAPEPEPFTANLDDHYLWTLLFADARAEDPLDSLISEGCLNGGGGKLISFSIARPSEEMFPLEDFRRCCSEVLRNEGHALLQLGPSDGYPPLKEFLRGWLREDGLQVEDDELLITNGGQQAFDLLRKVFLRPGDVVAMENPVYPGAIQTFNTGGIKCLGVPVTDEGLNLDALESVLTQHRVRLLQLTPTFHNPTGTTLPLEGRKRVLALAARHQIPVLEDHIYGALRLRGREVPSLKALDRHGLVIHLNSFSKMGFPGLRVGWMVASRPVIERLRLVKQATDLHTDQLAQAALAEFGRRGYLARMLKRVRRVDRSRLETMEAALAEHFPGSCSWVRPEGGMTVWVRLPRGIDAGALLYKARERNVVFTPGRYFYLQAAESNTMRLGFTTLPEEKIKKGIRILGGLIRREIGQRKRNGREREESARVALV